MFNPIFMDRFLVDYQFDEDISEDYQRYLRDQVQKIRINQVKPIHELINWFLLLRPTIKVRELDLHGSVARTLEFTKCELKDHELVYTYAEQGLAMNYLVWAYTESLF